jgi:uncharacterized protein YxeA
MELSTAAIAGVITVILSIGGSYMATKSDVAVNANDIVHITKQLDRIEEKIDEIRITQ